MDELGASAMELACLQSDEKRLTGTRSVFALFYGPALTSSLQNILFCLVVVRMVLNCKCLRVKVSLTDL